MTHRHLTAVAAFVLAIVAAVPASSQAGKWAAPDDPAAKYMIDSERQWAEASCTHNQIAQKILADDFQGTSPEGERYDKATEVAGNADVSKTEKDCRLLGARVRFFGDDLALIYGSETAVRKSTDGKESPRCLIWTDTWLKRNGTWQIVAAQDTQFNCP